MRKRRNFLDSPQCFGLVLVVCVGLLAMTARSGSLNKPAPGAKRTQAGHPSTPRDKKFIGRYQTFANDPVQIDLKINDRPVQLNSHLKSRNANWLEGLTVAVRNTSAKRILRLTIGLMFPETKSSDQPLMVFELRYGADPQVAKALDSEPALDPGQEIQFEISGNRYNDLTRFLAKRNVSIENINAVNVDLGLVIFDDDTAWATGSLMRRNPNNPKSWHDVK